METKPPESVSLISNHFKTRRKLSSQKSRPIKCKLDINLSANQQCENNSSTESNIGKKRKRTTKQNPVGSILDNEKVDVNLSANQQCKNNLSNECNNGKKRKRTTKQKPVGSISRLDNENTEILPNLDEIRKFIWDSLDKSINLDSDQTVELDESIVENVSSERAEASGTEATNLIGPGISLTEDTKVRSSSSLSDLDESLLQKENSVAADQQLNESKISLTEEISFSNVHCSSSYDLDESILKDVSSEEREVNVPSGIQEEEDEEEVNTLRNVHSLSSSCTISMISECNSQNILNSITEEHLSYTHQNISDIFMGNIFENSSTRENNASITNESHIVTTVETEKSSDPVKTRQSDSKSNEEDASILDESLQWECEELEQSFSDIADDLEKLMEEQQADNKSFSEKCDATRLSQTKEKNDGQFPEKQSTTPKKSKRQVSEISQTNITDNSSPAKFSPHIAKSPKKYFGSNANRKIVKEIQNSSPSSSFQAKFKGSSVTSNGSNKSKSNNIWSNQKRISEYFSQSAVKSNIGTKLKEAIDILDSTPGTSKNINVEDKKYPQLYSNVYLRIFEDCLEHIQKVILPVEHYLFDENELRLLNLVDNLNCSAKCLYFRLLDRKHFWIKRSKINYEDLNPSMNEDLIQLEALGLLSSDYTKEDIHILLELLNIPDLKKMCRLFRVGDQGNKCSLILNLTKMTDKQTTLDGKRDSHYLIRKELKNFLDCVKLSSKPRATFLKCLRIYSFSYNREVEEKMVQNIVNNNFKANIYPKFVVKHAVVFHNKENFDEYEKSLQLLSQVMTDSKPNNHQHLLELVKCARTKFEQCLSSESNRRILERTPDYLMKFTAANVYAGIVFSNINVLKKDKTNKIQMDEAVEFLETLIQENIFLSKKRGQIYDALIRIYRQKKDFHKAFSTFKKAREDGLIPQLIQFTLLAQMKPMLRQKAVSAQIKSKLQAVFNLPWFSCTAIKTITVLAKSIPSDKPNRKKVYVTKSEDYTLYQSVEELVVNHFKKSGWYGVHDEGSLLKNIIFACFWDIIFESPTLENDTMSVFVSKYQMRPLDWGSRTFYSRSESAIKERLIAIENSDWRAVYDRVNECLKNHAGESFNKSIWNWIKHENLKNIEGFLMCLSTKFIASVAEWLLRDLATYSSGFPDCTLWNRKNQQCLFVEVKSPSDTLAKHQEFWLKQIEEFGGSSLICHVKEIASCSSSLNSENDK
ncbi:hypothetical protein LSTR_LSTR000185 [Laodelphax striatellus]|uniref:Fanconi-associated nuclease n=1 Tax=Laodelphax striatellus TaxID=195883 RepID=A0A482X831_LAOST|nr:hypothetical protein LSTR_LSTR000185 [Laodelphax striatellus]